MSRVNNSKARRRVVKSFRLTEPYWNLVKQECAIRKIEFSEFVRQSLLGNLKYMRRAAIESWGRYDR
jgi:hypothetical protein